MAFKKPPSTSPNESPNMDLHKLQAGCLGKLFGVGDNAGTNVAGLAVILGLLLGTIVTIFMLYTQIGQNTPSESPYEIWKYIAPVVTGALGYLFGKK